MTGTLPAAVLLRVYLDPAEITPSGQYEGYPRTWWNPSIVSGYVRHPKWVESHGPVEYVVTTWKPGDDLVPDPAATEPQALLSRVELPTVKNLIRERDGHRCLRCGHPYAKGMGEWSRCSTDCTHLGPVRSREIMREGEWNQYDLDRIGQPAGEGILDEGPNGQLERWEVEAQWRILTVHHLNGVKADCRWWNLVSLCQRCHLLIQAKVHMARSWNKPHSEWFRPFVASYYAWAILGEELTQEETLARIDELLALEQTQDPLF